jgi:hypothetical protein
VYLVLYAAAPPFSCTVQRRHDNLSGRRGLYYVNSGYWTVELKGQQPCPNDSPARLNTSYLSLARAICVDCTSVAAILGHAGQYPELRGRHTAPFELNYLDDGVESYHGR